MGMSKILGRVVALLMVGTGVSTPIIVNNLNLATDEGDTPSIEESLNVKEETSIVGTDPALRVESTSQPKESSKEQPTVTPVVAFTPDLIESTIVSPPASNSPEWSDPSGVRTSNEYWAKYAGVCPDAQPKDSTFWEQERYLAFARHADHKWPTPIYYVDVYWGWHMQDASYTGKRGVANFSSLGFDNHYANSHVGLWIDYDTMTIYWDKMSKDGQFTPTTPLPYWETAAQEANAYLKQLDASYHAHCGV